MTAARPIAVRAPDGGAFVRCRPPDGGASIVGGPAAAPHRRLWRRGLQRERQGLRIAAGPQALSGADRLLEAERDRARGHGIGQRQQRQWAVVGPQRRERARVGVGLERLLKCVGAVDQPSRGIRARVEHAQARLVGGRGDRRRHRARVVGADPRHERAEVRRAAQRQRQRRRHGAADGAGHARAGADRLERRQRRIVVGDARAVVWRALVDVVVEVHVAHVL